MRFALGQDVEAFIPVRQLPPVEVTAQIEDPATDTVIVGPVDATLERIAGVKWYPSKLRAVVTLPPPEAAGDYLVRWVNSAEPTWEVLVPLFVFSAEQARALGLTA
jgi:hypothetical protein